MTAPASLRRRLPGPAGGAGLCLLAGVIALFTVPIAQLSFDLPFLLRPDVNAPDVVIIYLDEGSRTALGQPPDQPWDRTLHARVLNRLTRDQARLVFYDILFLGSQPADPDFARAIETHGNVILTAEVQSIRAPGARASAHVSTASLPAPLLAKAARGVGTARLVVEDKFGVRRVRFGDELPSAVWAAATAAGAPVTRDPSASRRERWMNFLGPSPAFDSIRFIEALNADGVPTNFFKGKTVFIGGHPSLFEREAFATPYTRVNLSALTPGVELLATAYVNLTRGTWLERVPMPRQFWLVFLYAIGAGAGLTCVRPGHALWLAGLAAATTASASFYLQWQTCLWWSWATPVLVQTPVALVWSTSFQYLTERAQRRRLRRAFGAYLSPHLADRIAESGFDLAPGGQVLEATVLFTDLEGFTPMTEKLDPREVSRILTQYFERTTRHILQEEGTIIKYIGDAVFAVWGAPLPEPHHARRAVRAACGIIEASRGEVEGRSLRTRIGINTGPVLAGNLGSSFRFDYTVIGATTNIAQRLEQLNKKLGTQILIGTATCRQLGPEAWTRRAGKFRLRGVEEPQEVHEVIPPGPGGATKPAWLATFARALEALGDRRCDEAETLFQEVIKARGGDSLSAFYLARLPVLRAEAAQGTFSGVLEG